MPGGTWTAQNKIRPGAYLNFKSVPRPVSIVGDRGIVSFPMALTWGAEGELIDFYSDELLNDLVFQSTLGMTAHDEAARPVITALSHSYLARIFRLDRGGTKASVTAGELTVTAKHPGTFGNEITMVIEQDGALYNVLTYVRGSLRDTQRVAVIGELDENAFVTFGGDAAEALTIISSTPLMGGTNGTVNEATAYEEYAKLLLTARVNTFAVPSNETTIQAKMALFVEEQRDQMGRKMQCVVHSFEAADHEGVIRLKNAPVFGQDEMSLSDTTILFAGMSAGVALTEDNTARLINGATGVTGNMTPRDIDAALRRSWIVFATSSDGSVRVVDDINSLHTFTQEKNEAFRENMIIRTLDELGTVIPFIWENTFMGRVLNNEDGRALFKGAIIGLINDRQAMGLFENFNGAEDVDVRKGEKPTAVVATARVIPVGMMKHLYMTFEVNV